MKITWAAPISLAPQMPTIEATLEYAIIELTPIKYYIESISSRFTFFQLTVVNFVSIRSRILIS